MIRLYRRLLRRLRQKRFIRRMSGKALGPRFKNYGFIIAFTVVVLVSCLSVFTNVLFSVVLTTGAYSDRSLFARLANQEPGHNVAKRSLMEGEFPLDMMRNGAIQGAQGVVADYDQLNTNQTQDILDTNNTYQLGLSANESTTSDLTDVLPTANIPLVHVTDVPGLQPGEPQTNMNGAPPGMHPWWWVDFKVDNDTYEAEIDAYLTSIAQFHHFTLNVTLEDVDSLKVELPPLIPNMRNPCWLELVPNEFTYEDSLYKCHINYRRLRKSFAYLTELINKRARTGPRWRIRCFPSFFLIGVAKCGTTDLYEAMIQHPDIITSELKEPEYWSRQRYGTNPWLFQTDCPAYRARPRATFGDYLDTYDNASEALKRSFLHEPDGSWHSDTIFGDYSTHTMEELFFWDRSKDEPELITANHIHKLRPETKFIVILRDPVERAYSRYKMRFKNRGNVAGTADDFHSRMVKQIAGTEACLRMYKRRVCVYKENIGKAGDHTILVNGMYIIYIKDWLEVFPLEQMMILRFEDYIMDRIGHIERITEFLGLNPMPDADKDRIRSMPAANAGISIGSGMSNETMLHLQDFFRPLNRELVELTGDERFTWGY